MLEWLSVHRADVAAVIILILVVMFLSSIYIGVKTSRRIRKDQVFGDPEGTLGGWYWAVCGISVLMLLWFYYSWGMARAYFPRTINEMCQIAKVEEALSPIIAQLPISSRYYKSTSLVVRNIEQLNILEANLPEQVFTDSESRQLRRVLDQSQQMLAIYSDPANQSYETRADLGKIKSDIIVITKRLRDGYDGMTPTAEALAQPRWGVASEEIPLLPTTAKGVLFDSVAVDSARISNDFLKLRNIPDDAKELIEDTRNVIKSIRDAPSLIDSDEARKTRDDYIKAVDRVFKRLDDGLIFSAEALAEINGVVVDLFETVDDTKGGLRVIDALFFPGGGVVKSRTLCIEQGSSRWLPKPTDVIATFGRLANPNVEEGGGYKGTRLLWVKWLAIANIVDFLIPDTLVDSLPGVYGQHDTDGGFIPTYKDKLLTVAQGDISLGYLPMFEGHIWDSLLRVLVALSLGILLGVPLGIYMGVSRFFKSFFDPMIELYRPVPPLAWAPLILTIFGIQDDGKIFLLFMVAFAIMVISARTGASGTQLSKIRASHSLGASNGQILRHVILPNALPEILTGVRIAIGVCWGTLVAAEMLAGTTGIGFIENVARTVSDYELIWVTILIMGLLGLIFDLIMRRVIAILIPWRGKG